MTDQEIIDLFEEFEATMVRRFDPLEYGEDSDLSVIYSIAKELMEEAINRGKKSD